MKSPCIEDGAIVEGELCGCRFWITIAGKTPAGEDVNKGECSFAWTPILLIENSDQQRKTAAAIDLFRNEMVVANGNSQLLLTTQKP